MADNEILASASCRTLATFATRFLIAVEAGSLILAAKLRSDDVKGNLPSRVRASDDSYRPGRWSLASEDLGAQNSYNVAQVTLGHKNAALRAGKVLHEGVRVRPRAQSSAKAVLA
ncbi:hypothetical protein [Rhizobium sp. S96]|uniref:hypothetical protein n=1 Tax=Rhizobium sp. S96 TaxID=3055140 RepID=UPI0025AAF938|nr:hypothetical protein [Rhizobium sp. S96]MDM9618786.1 hypothetical protein [Rhizobium sp. S96]